ncbi:MAG: thiamine pyrophosphate-binding protein [Bryobacteraceae bacterium]
MPTGAELFVQSIRKLGIEHIFTLVGDHLNDVLPVAQREGIRLIDMRHESGCTHAADALARVTRKPAMSLVTGGPGHTNSLTGIATAQLAASPLIAVSGSRGTLLGGRGAFQDIEQVGMAAPVCKYAAEVPSASQIPFYLGRAFKEASSGRKGAVHLSIPVDVFGASTETPSALPMPFTDAVCAPGSREIGDALALLKSAQRPIIIAGSGLWWGDAGAELQAFIEKSNLPLYTITMARGVVPDSHPLCFGYGDPALNYAVHTSFKEADVILMLGKRIDYRMALGGPRLFSPQTRFIQVDIHPQELGLNRKLDVAICADVKATLRAMAGEIGAPWAPKPWLGRLRELKAQWQEKVEATALTQSSPLHPAAFYGELRKWLPKNLCYVWDGGDFVHWGRVILPALDPGRWLRLGPLGTIGSALPNCVAAKVQFPDKPVVMITGDGSLGFYLAELDTLVRHNLPVVLIVGNDAGWGVERELQGGGANTVVCELRRTRYDLVMRGLGGGGETIDTLDQVGPAVERAFSSGMPYLLNVNVAGAGSPFTQWQLMGKKK